MPEECPYEVPVLESIYCKNPHLAGLVSNMYRDYHRRYLAAAAIVMLVTDEIELGGCAFHRSAQATIMVPIVVNSASADIAI